MKQEEVEILKKYSEWLSEKDYLSDAYDLILNKYLKSFDDKFTEEIIKTIHYIHNKYKGEVVFCGSFGLVLNKLLNRPIHDIDVLTFENHYIFNDDNDREIGGSGRFYVDGKLVFRHKETVNNIDVDVLYREDKIDYNVIEFYGVNIKVESPQSAIKAKKQYLESNENHVNKDKHLNDLKEIQNNLGF